MVNGFVVVGLIGTLLCLSGCIGLPPESGYDIENQALPHVDSALACQQDSDCVYAINAFDAPRCASPNCPPEEQTQPQPYAEGYEWENGFREGCINPAATQGKDAQGEEFQINPRASCACVSVENSNQKMCQTN
ncbi:MAG: hypothetical protein IPJ89_04100 [Candidatus Iainarchaeum archaeon]|uniref:Uncharacterized protein n=1 Tax=Candidatus Iainarchaeum sp. TaxID=3101447 RepID=A0A7T9DJ61_9ARCH|nr:MAG: hypothetical protein IPJ89_04100 [Candidatus Diapherotrites archaeon]